MATLVAFRYTYLLLGSLECFGALVVFVLRADLRRTILIAGVIGGCVEIVSEVWYMSKRQFGNERTQVITEPPDLSCMLAGFVSSHYYSLRFFAVAGDPPPRQSLGYADQFG